MKHVLPPCGDAAAERRRILFQTKGISWHGASMSRADCDVRQERNTYRHILTSDFVYPSPAHPMLTHPEKPQAADIDNSINFGVRGQGGTAHTLSSPSVSTVSEVKICRVVLVLSTYVCHATRQVL